MTPHPTHSVDQIADAPEGKADRGWRFAMGRAFVLLILLLFTLVVIGWIERDQIARDLIGEQLDELGIPATYDVERIDTERQVLANVVIGDPDSPDLTIERVIVTLAYGFGVPEIATVTLVKPRLYGSYRNGALSFGALDPALFGNETEDGGLPALDIAIRDGRGLIKTDFGDVGLKLEGEGPLDDGFKGTLAAIVPEPEMGGCRAGRVSAYGTIETAGDDLQFRGPLRMAKLRCPPSVNLTSFAWQTNATIGLNDGMFEGRGRIAAEAIETQFGDLSAVSGPLKLRFDDKGVLANYDVTGENLRTAELRAATIDLNGTIRTDRAFTTAETEMDLAATDMILGNTIPAAIASLATSVDGTLAAPLLSKFRRATIAETRGSRLRGSVSGRWEAGALSVTVPEAVLRNASGGLLASASRIRYANSGAGLPNISGNFRVAGDDLPQLAGRMEQTGSGASFRLQMQRYLAGSSALAIPQMQISRTRNGGYRFDGSVRASGPLPGGRASNLQMPVSGQLRANGVIDLWQRCTRVAFDGLSYANLRLDRRSLTICPARGRPIVRFGNGRLAIAAGLPSLDVAGSLAGTPIRVKSGPIGFAYPGAASARDLSIVLGPDRGAARFDISGLKARFGRDVDGTFEDADIAITAVPLDLSKTEGRWRYSNGVLAIDDARFILSDRNETGRFVPLPVVDGRLRLEDNIVTATARVLAPTDRRPVTGVSLTHNLSTGAGSADLDVSALRFDDGLQPDMLTPLLLGVVANVDGIIRGTGRIDWSGQSVTSSGVFSSDALDLAAAFGPVKGASGTIAFTDLLSLTTAPDQRIDVASINPGIEVENGSVAFSLRDGKFLGVSGGSWPFMGGTLYLRPVELNLGEAEERDYLLEVEGLDAALFVENLELGNIAATGIFDGVLPLVFDEEGFGRIIGGRLQSRPPGGNVSYVGELTYEDLSPIANYAFETLRSLDYESMSIAVDGPITGDIETRVQFDGVTQGEGTKTNFITREIAKLPIRFRVNITAPFYKLMGSLKSIYDPAAVRDPRELGLLEDDGTRFLVPQGGPADGNPDPATPDTPADDDPDTPAILRGDRKPIQYPDSEDKP
ncbi:MAG: YdbH domain-containing protein [Pontixanthobacter sp.]